MTKDERSGISALAYELGEILETNEDLERQNPSWDMSRTENRTGIASRTIAAEGTTALDLGEKAAFKLLSENNIDKSEIDGLIFCSQTPDYPLPPNSTLLHGRLGLSANVMSFDITHACSGFVYSIGIAKSLVDSGAARSVLVVTGDTYSRIVHPQDRSVRAIFGDGATATLITKNATRFSIRDMSFGTSGRHADRFIIENGGSKNEINLNLTVHPDKNARVHSPNHIQMDGLKLISFFNSILPKDIRKLLEKNEHSIDDIDYFVFHQASQLVISGLTKTLKVNPDKVILDMKDTGNLVSSSIPVVLKRLMDSGKISPNQNILICGFGVGLSWSCGLFQSQ